MLREITRPASLGKEMTWKPLRSPVLELTGTVGNVFDKLLHLQTRSWTSTEENPVTGISQELPV